VQQLVNAGGKSTIAVTKPPPPPLQAVLDGPNFQNLEMGSLQGFIRTVAAVPAALEPLKVSLDPLKASMEPLKASNTTGSEDRGWETKLGAAEGEGHGGLGLTKASSPLGNSLRGLAMNRRAARDEGGGGSEFSKASNSEVGGSVGKRLAQAIDSISTAKTAVTKHSSRKLKRP
jgi:hypothetical protein